MTPERPLLRYFGGKWRMAPWLLDFFPPHRIYVESFGGGASVLLRKERTYGEVYNDLDGEVVNVFRVLQRHHRRFRRLLAATPFSRDEFELAMNKHQVKDPVERARRTVIRSFMGFGSDSVTRGGRTGFRANSNRSGTTPAHDWASWPEQIQAFHERLRDVIVENRDAKEVMASQDGADTLHYVDPPYVHATRANGANWGQRGYRFEMTNADHEELIAFLKTLKGMVIVSGYHHPIYDGLGWATATTTATTTARTFHKENRSVNRTETIWMNPACVATQAQMDFLHVGGGISS